VRFWVIFLPEVERGLHSFGFPDPLPDRILRFVRAYLGRDGDKCAPDRWPVCPDDFFVYSHLFVEGGRYQSLEFVVNDTEMAVGVLRVVWVEHRPGSPVD
jgi:hypothetical protein